MMIPYLRKTKILEELANKDIVVIDDLLNILPEVSISTIRRDLKELENEKKVVLLTGGAVKLNSSTLELPISTKIELNKKKKNVIAELAYNLIKDGETIYLDSGTTCTLLAEKLLEKQLTIVTSNMSLANLRFPKSEVIFLGGMINEDISSLYGPITDNNLKMFNFDKAFIGTSGISVTMGISTPNIFEANKKAIAKQLARESYILCDSSKFNKGMSSKAFELDDCIVVSNKYDAEISAKVKMIVPK